MRVKEHRNIFIDSRAGKQVDHKYQVNFPSTYFNCGNNELMRLTLNSFEMRRNYYMINDYNKTFFAYSNDALGVAVAIPSGDYHTYDELAAAIQTGLRAATAFGGTPTCTYDENARQFTFDMSGAASNWDSTNGYFVAFQDKSYNSRNASIYFQDTAEILGGTPELNVSATTPANLFGSTGDDHSSIFPPQLDTIGDIFITTNLQTNNFSTHNFDRGTSGENTLTSTQIFARIPVERDMTFSGSNYVPLLHDRIKYSDENDLYSVYIQNKQLNNIIFDIVDDKNRPIPRVEDRQFTSGNLNYRMTLKWEVLALDIEPQGRPAGLLEGKYSSVITQ